MCYSKKLIGKIMHQIKTFIFMDLETTGLPVYEHNRTKITELCFISVQSAHIELGCWPRVLNKLNVCLYPNKGISETARKLTGLSNELLEEQGTFNSDTVDLINKFLKQNKEPICLIAHNGYNFDFPIFKSELFKAKGNLPDNVLCIDTIEAFKELDKPLTPEIIIYNSEEEFLLDASRMVETKDGKKLTLEEIQKINETTPKKQMISNSEQSEPNAKRKCLFSDNTTPESYKLSDVYSRLTKKRPLKAHEAEADVIMLIHCCAVYAEKFVDYANRKAKLLADIPMMRPGIPIGK